MCKEEHSEDVSVYTNKEEDLFVVLVCRKLFLKESVSVDYKHFVVRTGIY